MWSFQPDLLAIPVPRYTSYPTALAFDEQVGEAAMAAALSRVGPGDDISIYVHIPYCEQLCWYCGCNTGVAGKAERLSAYLRALEADIALVGKMLGGRPRLRRLAFGGGSPNAISPIAFVRLVDRILTMMPSEQPEISIEIDPRAMTADWPLTLAAAQVSRVSFGVQSFSPAVQAAIGRIQPALMIEARVASLRMRGITQINFDLMYGLPGQTMDDVDSTLDAVIGMAPSRIALFGYAHHPAMFPRQRRIDASALPGPGERFRQAAKGFDRLVAAGYQPIGFDHFALPDDGLAVASREGRVRRNFQGFTDDPAQTVIGVGASAISQFPDLIVQNEKNPGSYRGRVAAGRLAGARGIARDADAQSRTAVIEALLCAGHAVLPAALQTRDTEDRLAALVDRGLVHLEGAHVTVRTEALPYARLVAAAFDTAFAWPAQLRKHQTAA